MRKVSLLAALILTLVLFQYCSSSRKAQAAPAVTYENNVHQIITTSCTPCHTGGKQVTLNTYAAASGHIDDIITRISKNPDEKGFMPFKHPKLPDSTINVFVRWKQAGMPVK